MRSVRLRYHLTPINGVASGSVSAVLINKFWSSEGTIANEQGWRLEPDSCLKKSGITARASLETASTLVVKENGNAHRIVLPKSWPKAIGVYLFKPGVPARVIYAENGPGSLIEELPQAAAEYFAAPACGKAAH